MNRRTRLGAIALMLALTLVATLLAGCGKGVPEVTGMTPADAVRTLEDAGYKLGDVSYGSQGGVALGAVMSQTPAAGERAKDGTAVDLQINGNDGKTAIVPNVIQQTQTTAVEAVETCGLHPVVSFQYIDTIAKDEVITQSPTGGNKAGIGAPVIIVVSQGKAPEKKAVPDVMGKKQADAESALESAGFVAKVYSIYSSKVAKGVVGFQVPDAGAMVSPGSTVEIAVSLGPGTGSIKVPNVIGKKEADATGAIKSAGLVANVFYADSDTVAKGIVINQSPDASTSTGKGSQVAIVVSRGKPAAEPTVPDVTGKTQADATAALGAAGFTVTTEQVVSTSTPGSVVYQFPEAGAPAASGSSVLIAIAKAQ